MALTKVKADGLTADLIDETKLADNSIDSEHYNDGSIDNAHLADDAVGVAELSATGTASSSTFLRGDNSWATVSAGTALTGSTDNTICTVTGANAIAGEANLTFTGTTLDFKQGNNSNNTANGNLIFSNGDTAQVAKIAGLTGSSSDDGQIRFYTKNGGTETEALRISEHSAPKLQMLGGETEIISSASDGSLTLSADPGQNRSSSGISLKVDASEKFSIDANGHAKIHAGNLEFASGNGIDFSANSDGSRSISTDGNKFDDYEEGTFTPTIRANANTNGATDGTGSYVKVGKKVTIHVNIGNKTLTGFPGSGPGVIRIDGLPFTCYHNVGDEFGISSKCIIMGVDNNSNNVYFRTNHASTALYGYYNADGSTWVYHDAGFYDNSGVYVIFNLTYFTST